MEEPRHWRSSWIQMNSCLMLNLLSLDGKRLKTSGNGKTSPDISPARHRLLFLKATTPGSRICCHSSCSTCSLTMTCSSWSPPSLTSTSSSSLGARPSSQLRISECFWPSFFSLATTKSPTTSSIGPTRKTLRTRWSRMPCPGTGSYRSSTAFTWVRTWSWRATVWFIFIQLFSLFSSTYEKINEEPDYDKQYSMVPTGKYFKVCLSVCLYVCMSVCMYICMSACLFVCLSFWKYS